MLSIHWYLLNPISCLISYIHGFSLLFNIKGCSFLTYHIIFSWGIQQHFLKPECIVRDSSFSFIQLFDYLDIQQHWVIIISSIIQGCTIDIMLSKMISMRNRWYVWPDSCVCIQFVPAHETGRFMSLCVLRNTQSVFAFTLVYVRMNSFMSRKSGRWNRILKSRVDTCSH